MPEPIPVEEIPDDVLFRAITQPPLDAEGNGRDVLREWCEQPFAQKWRLPRLGGVLQLLRLMLRDDVIRWRLADLMQQRSAVYAAMVRAGLVHTDKPRQNIERVGGNLEKWLREVIPYAHDPAHWLHVEEGKAPAVPDDAQRFYSKAPGWETAVILTYTVDVVKGLPNRHLQVQFRYPGAITQGDLNVMLGQGAPLKEWFDVFVQQFFPLHTAVYRAITALTPIPRQENDPSGRGKRMVYQTPIVCRAWIRHDLDPMTASEEVIKAVQQRDNPRGLVGADGKPL